VIDCNLFEILRVANVQESPKDTRKNTTIASTCNTGQTGKPKGFSPASGFAILTRADSDAAPAQYENLGAGEALVIRKADGRASDEAIDSLVLSHKLLGTRKWIVVHVIGDDNAPLFDHVAAGDLLRHGRFVGDDAAELLSNRPAPGVSTKEWNEAWIRFWQAASRNLGEVAAVIREDIDRIRNHPRTPAGVKVEGYIRDVKLGGFSRV
jgi:carbonic anhydrase